MSCPDLELHCYSGTGNTRRVATWIADAARDRGWEVAIASVPSRGVGGRAAAPETGRRLLGVLAPTHGFTAPWPALVCAATVPDVRGADVFVAVTRAGWYLGPLRLPGFEGTAAWLLAVVLVLRGGRLVGVRAIDMPSNWTSLHWGLSPPHVAAIVRNAESRTAAFAERLLDGHTQLTGWLILAAGLAVVPISLLYLVVAREMLGRLFFADERCTSCALCAQRCPTGAIRMAGHARRTPYWTRECESCMRCMNVCPERAIQADWLLAAALTWVWFLAYEAIAALPALSGTAALVVATIAASVPMLILAGPAYALLWRLMRGPRWSGLRGRTTPTRLYRRYSEPGTDLRDI